MTATDQRKQLLALALAGIAPFLFNGLVNSKIAHSALLYWGFELLTWVIIPALIAWRVARMPGLKFADLGYRIEIAGRRDRGLLLLACALFAPLCYGLYRVSYRFFGDILPDDAVFSYDSIVPESGFAYYAVIVYFALSAGLVEEFLYRGLIWRALAGLRHASVLFLLLSPLLFSIVHWEDGFANLAATWAFGLFMALAWLGLRNLWPLVVGHIFTDLVWFA